MISEVYKAPPAQELPTTSTKRNPIPQMVSSSLRVASAQSMSLSTTRIKLCYEVANSDSGAFRLRFLPPLFENEPDARLKLPELSTCINLSRADPMDLGVT